MATKPNSVPGGRGNDPKGGNDPRGGQGGQGGQGGGQGGGEGGNQEMAKLAESMNNLANIMKSGFQQLHETNQRTSQQLLEGLGNLSGGGEGRNSGRGGQGGGQGNRGNETPQDPFEGKDIESLPRKEFAQLQEQRLLNTIKSQFFDPLQDSLQKLSGTIENKTVNDQVKEASGKHPDFWEWKQEMATILKASPDMSIEDAYILSRAKHPEKAKEIDEKAQKDEEERKKAAGGGEGTGKGTSTPGGSPFLGMQPGGATGEVPKTDMSADEAAQTAFEEVTGSLPPEVRAALLGE